MVIGRLLLTSRRAWGWSVRAYESAPGERRKLKRHLRWAALAALRGSEAKAWFQWLDSAELRPFVEANPRLAFRPMGGYLCRDWGWERRVKVIQDTYAFLLAQGGALKQAMLRPEGLTLMQLPLGRARDGRVRLGVDAQFRKEGELAVSLELEGVGGAISSMALSLERRPADRWTAYVGAVQGRKGGDEETIKAATKALHGLRPKQFLVLLAQEIARALRMQALLGAGNRIQVFRGLWTQLGRTRREIRFDYDELWLEAGGVADGEGWFHLPLHPHRRAVEEMKPNKRSMYAKRYAFLDQVSRQVRTALSPY
jgi:uncharacterized protein VirK/YbjX